VKSDHETSEPTPEANDDAQELSDDELDDVAGGSTFQIGTGYPPGS
jgi:hypothetical protein